MRLLNKHKQSPGQAGGVALILVVWVMVVLIAIVGEFSYSMRTEINITRNFKEDEQAYHLAVAGLEAAKAEILSAKDPSKMYVAEDKVLLFDRDSEAAPVREEDLGNGKFKYNINDEDGKLNINTATEAQLKQFFLNAGLEATDVDTIVGSILDWIDTDDLHRLNGAEEDYYQSLEAPYSCKDGPLSSVDELLLVKGMTPEVLYGPKESGRAQGGAGLAQYLTVATPDNKINVNTAPKAVLDVILTPEAADSIILQRETAQVTVLSGSYSKVSSDFFTIISTGSNTDGTIKRTIKTIVHRKGGGLEAIYWNDNII